MGRRDPRRLGAVAAALGALVLTALVAAAALWAGGYDPVRAFTALVGGALGSSDAVFSITLVRSVPLILTGLAVALAFRGGVWNIGAEGQLYAGAVAAVWLGVHGGSLPSWALIPAVLGASALAGAAWAAVPMLMKLRLGVGEVITTLLMNFVAIDLTAYAVHGPLQESRHVFPQTDPIATGAHLPILVQGTRLHAGFAVAVGLAALLWAFFRWTSLGFAVRAVGASPEAAHIAGRMDADRVVRAVFLGSGALAGLAGGVEVAGVTYALYEGLSPGWGYTAIAVALLAGLEPGVVVLTGIFFGMLEGGAGAMQRTAGIPSVWVSAIEALVILSVLAVDAVRRRGRWRGVGARSSEEVDGVAAAEAGDG